MTPGQWLRATRIALALAKPREQPVREHVLKVEGAPGKVLIYDPPGTPRGAVAIVPGLALEAHDDARLHNLAKGFTRGGFRGMVLEVPDISSLRIRPQTEQDLAARITALYADDLVPEGRLGLLGPSFSGSLALRAASRPEVADRVHSVLTVGAFADASRTVDYLFHADDADPYGRMLLMLNFLDVVEEVSPALLDTLWVAIHDTGREAEEAKLSHAMSKLSNEERTRLQALLNEPSAWQAVGDLMLELGGDIFQAMSIPPIIDRLRCAVFVMHGRGDTIVPPHESVELDAALRQAGLPSRLVITSILDHANIQGGMTMVREGVSMIGGFAHFVQGMDG